MLVAMRKQPITRCESNPVAVALELRRWYAQDPGQQLMQALQGRLDQLVPELFGYHALQIGQLGAGEDLLGASRIRHRAVLDVAGSGACIARPDALPIQNESTDLVLLPHVLEFAIHPHEVLREIDRILVPEGHVIIVAFNPLSLYGIWRLALGWRGGVPWCGRFYGARRLRDWLSLLGFDTLRCETFGFRIPLGEGRRLAFLERLGERWTPYFGAVSLILARNRVATLTPIRARWRPRRSVLGSGLAEPSSRVMRLMDRSNDARR